MRSFWQMTLANIRMTLRNRMALFWLMMFPLLFIVMFGYLIPGGDFSLRIGVAGEQTSPMAEAVVEQMEAVEAFDVSRGTAEDERQSLEAGDRNVVVLFSEGEGESPAAAEIIYDQTDVNVSQIAVSTVEQFLMEAELQATGQPRLIETTSSGVDSEEFKFIDFFVPGILAMALMTNGVIGLSTEFVSYREQGVLRRMKATPFPLWAFILSKISVQLLIAMAQAAVLLGTGVVLFGVHISSSYVSLVLMIAFGALAFLSIGFAVSAFARDAETAAGISNVIVFPMLFLGGVFFPVENAPAWLFPVTQIIPVTHLASGFREIVLEGATIFDVWPSVAVMLATSVVGVMIAVRFFRWESRTV